MKNDDNYLKFRLIFCKRIENQIKKIEKELKNLSWRDVQKIFELINDKITLRQLLSAQKRKISLAEKVSVKNTK